MNSLKRELGVLLLSALALCSSLYAQQTDFEKKIGASTFETVVRTQGLYTNERLLDLVKKVGQKLEAQIESPKGDFKYYLVDVVEPNAFATAGGYVFVTRGLLTLLKTEDELACVLGHEFIHVLNHHTRKTLYRGVLPAILELPGNIIGAITLKEIGQLINLPVELTSKTINSVFARHQENEADSEGVLLARKAGYNPADFMAILKRLQREVDYITGKSSRRHLFDDHPLTADRVERINNQLETLPVTMKASVPVIKELDGLLVGQNAANGIVDKSNIFMHPDLSIYMHLPTGWVVQNTPTALTAVDPDRRSVLTMGIDQEHSNIEDAVSAFVTGALQSRKIELDTIVELPEMTFQAAEAVAINGRKSVSIYMWADLGDGRGILQLIGSSKSIEDLAVIQASLASLRPLTIGELNRIGERFLRVDSGLEGETLEQFSSRHENSEIVDLLSIINDMKPGDPVEGRNIKYLHLEPYKLR